MFQKAWWVGLPAGEIEKKQIRHGDLNGRFAYYRCTAELMAGAKLTLNITAGSRYRLWVNGKPVCSGPCKGDLHRWYYDTVELTEYLVPGQNVFAVQVLFADHDATIFQEDQDSPIFSVYAPGGTHRLAAEGAAVNPDGSEAELTTGFADWRCFLDASRRVRNQQPTIYMGATCEEIDFSVLPHRWKQPDFDGSCWGAPEKLETVIVNDYMRTVGLVQRYQMKDRPIPMLYETECRFVRFTEPVTVGAGQIKTFLLDAEVEVNGFPRFSFSGGRGSRVSITWFEKFTGGKNKVDTTGNFEGITDVLHLNGEDVCHEPFWYKTFRFVSITVEAESETIIYPPVYRKTGYPMEVVSDFSASEGWVKEVYELCVRTLENCMMDTYMDCPFYEQNQFPMDTRLQALFCSAVSGDLRLTYKALEDFHCSITSDGLVHGRYPASYQQIISTFSLHYIYMLEETYQQSGDIGALKRYLPDLDRILSYYDDCIGSDGLVGRLGWWEFVDWQPKWNFCGGIPEALLHGPSTIINLMYALALEKAAVLWAAAGRLSLAAEYRARKKTIVDTVFSLCWDAERGMVREGPAFSQYTQHTQSWAVLTGMLEGQTAKTALRHAIDDADVLKCGFSTSYEWFRALEQAGMYEETKEYMMDWAALPAMGNTTCPEVPGDSRSECHAWSALPIYEFLRSFGGIRMEAGQVVVCPVKGYLGSYSGCVCIPGGKADFRYDRGTYTVTLPDRCPAALRFPDGTRETVIGGTHEILLN